MKKFIERVTNFIVAIFPFLIWIVIIVVSLLLSKLIFEAIVNSDMPDWVKYVLLK